MKPQKIKILFRIRALEMGGIQKVLIDVLTHVPKNNFDITLMVNYFQGELRSEIPDDIKIIKLARGKEDFSSFVPIQKIQLVFRRLKLMLLHRFSFLSQLYYHQKYDIEIAFGKPELEMVLNSPQKKSKKIAWVHWEFSHEPELNRSQSVINQLQKFDHIVFCSENVREQVKTMYGAEFNNSSVIHNVIHPKAIIQKSKENTEDIQKFNDELFTFVSVGRVKNGKGYPLLFNIHKDLWNKGLKHRILIIGDGDKFDELSQLAVAHELENSFVLLGNKNNPFPYMKNADFFILPTQSEAYPLSVKEALVLGIPVLATDTGGISEIISDGTDGMLMKYEEEDIGNKMEMLLKNPELVKTLKYGAEKAKDKFEIDEIYKQIENLLTFVCNNGN